MSLFFFTGYSFFIHIYFISHLLVIYPLLLHLSQYNVMFLNEVYHSISLSSRLCGESEKLISGFLGSISLRFYDATCLLSSTPIRNICLQISPLNLNPLSPSKIPNKVLFNNLKLPIGLLLYVLTICVLDTIFYLNHAWRLNLNNFSLCIIYTEEWTSDLRHIHFDCSSLLLLKAM